MNWIVVWGNKGNKSCAVEASEADAIQTVQNLMECSVMVKDIAIYVCQGVNKPSIQIEQVEE